LPNKHYVTTAPRLAPALNRGLFLTWT